MASVDKIVIDNTNYDIDDMNSVDTTAQSLTSAQRTQARNNIDASIAPVSVSATATAAGWSNDTPPTQTIAVNGAATDKSVVVGIASSVTSAQYSAAKNAKIVCTAHGTDTITLTAFGTAPTMDIPITVLILGDSSGPTLIPKTITQNGTYDAASDNADGYDQVTVNVTNGCLCEYNFNGFDGSRTVQGGSNYSIDGEGAHFTGASQYITVPFARAGMTIEVDVGEMTLTTDQHRRFVMRNYCNGFAYRSNGYWGLAYPVLLGWNWEMSSISDSGFFANSTLKVYIDSTNHWHIYRNNVLIFEPSHSCPIGDYEGIRGCFYIGSTEYSINNAVIKAVRVY